MSPKGIGSSGSLQIGEIEPHLKLELMIGGFDVGTEFVKRFVVLFFTQMGEFMSDDHSQKRLGRFFKQIRDPYLVFGFEFSPLYPRDEGMGSQRRLEIADFRIVEDFGNWHGVAQVSVF